MLFKLRFIQSGMMSFFLAFFMTAWITFLNLGITADYLLNWGSSFVFAWPAAFTIAFTISPTVAKWSASLHRKMAGLEKE
ncbi:DUF2798 domain-containing protein [Marinomonas sp. 15G1-11]|uniref:DUF2798 domain-containing protein n=1 Tax=Marinomonas phaeophyticola TaxID=3004091 RepID=A0ABT4JSL3_9GAMM|nr:DUF2798 domain-containing protein [Marinomonas sp. 15G1-11]MCZ2721261.1 DUF2798 domain-containing protein [Marinomonas sp. 15G1-11]